MYFRLQFFLMKCFRVKMLAPAARPSWSAAATVLATTRSAPSMRSPSGEESRTSTTPS